MPPRRQGFDQGTELRVFHHWTIEWRTDRMPQVFNFRRFPEMRLHRRGQPMQETAEFRRCTRVQTSGKTTREGY